MENKNSRKLKEFTRYCKENPKERFWQALRNWARIPYLLKADEKPFPTHDKFEDTFYWE